MTEDREKEYVTTRGIRILLQPVSTLLLQRVTIAVKKEFADRGESLDIPTYSYAVLGGDLETHELDETTLEDPNDPEQSEKNKVAWAKYLAANVKFNEEENERVTAAMLDGGVVLQDSDEDMKLWRDSMSWLNVPIAENPHDAKVQYLTTWALTDYDIAAVLMQIRLCSISGLADKEMMQASEELFQRSVRLKQREAVEAITNQIRQVVAQRAPTGDDRGEGVPPEAEPVRQLDS
jgi:hypothetical protein